MANSQEALQNTGSDKSRLPIEEFLSPEIIASITKDIRWKWRIGEQEIYQSQLVEIWSPYIKDHYERRMPCLTINPYQSTNKKKSRLPKTQLERNMEYLICNKATVCYWTGSVENKRDPGPPILAGIWKQWCDTIGREAKIEIDEFFAAPVRIEDKTPQTISDILAAHEAICKRVKRWLKNMKTKDKTDYMKIWRDTRYFKLLPLCEALVVVFDRCVDEASMYRRYEDGLVRCEEVVGKQSVVLVRTGREEELSGPVCFDSLKDDALPLGRDDVMEATDIVRVPLKVGVRFVANLFLHEEKQEEENGEGQDPEHPKRIKEREESEWVKYQFESALDRGLIEKGATEERVRELMMIRTREDYPPEDYEPIPFRSRSFLGWV